VEQREDDRCHETRLSENIDNLNRRNAYGLFSSDNRETQSLAPRRQTKFRALVLADQEARLKALVAATPDATLAELRAQLPTTAALSTLWLELDRLGLTVKKPRTRHRTASR
jgi:hypothetical protein